MWILEIANLVADISTLLFSTKMTIIGVENWDDISLKVVTILTLLHFFWKELIFCTLHTSGFIHEPCGHIFGHFYLPPPSLWSKAYLVIWTFGKPPSIPPTMFTWFMNLPLWWGYYLENKALNKKQPFWVKFLSSCLPYVMLHISHAGYDIDKCQTSWQIQRSPRTIYTAKVWFAFFEIGHHYILLQYIQCIYLKTRHWLWTGEEGWFGEEGGWKRGWVMP